jgi:hypothetical protein
MHSSESRLITGLLGWEADIGGRVGSPLGRAGQVLPETDGFLARSPNGTDHLVA